MKYKEAVEFLKDLGSATLHGSLPFETQHKLFQVATFMWGRADELQGRIERLEKVLAARGGQTLPTEYKLADQIKSLEEEIKRLKGESGIVEIEEQGVFLALPFIFSREVLVAVVDELAFRLKKIDQDDQMLTDFRTQVRSFIKRWNLDGDPHSFASLQERNNAG